MSHSPLDDFFFTRSGEFTRLCLSPQFVAGIQGDWLRVELPKTGQTVPHRDTFGFVHTDETSYPLRAPASLRIVAVNDRVIADANLARLSPTGEGWLLDVETLEKSALV